VFPGPCLQDEDLSKNPDCGKKFSGTSNWGLRLNGTELSLAPTKAEQLGALGPQSTCGKSADFNDLEQLGYGWPVPAPLHFAPLPLAKLFGHTSAFKVQLGSGFPSKTSASNTAGVTEKATDLGSTVATVRFIRVPNAP
jgi:hypothetical protein